MTGSNVFILDLGERLVSVRILFNHDEGTAVESNQHVALQEGQSRSGCLNTEILRCLAMIRSPLELRLRRALTRSPLEAQI